MAKLPIIFWLARIFENWKDVKQKKLHFHGAFMGGPERIRTAVDGFADRCLASRPQDPFAQFFGH